MRTIGTLAGLALVVAAGACEQPASPPAVITPGATRLANEVSEGVNSASTDAEKKASARGHGVYELAGISGVHFSFKVAQNEDGAASGHFRQVTSFTTGTVDIEGKVTCLAVDPVFGRAWIGGVVKRNASTDPSYALDPTTQPGQDVWCRVVDLDPATGTAEDRSTFLGFAGSAGFLTSAAYCAGRPWPADNARTHLVTKGRIEVRGA
jgi:hypothetical protein